MELRTASAASVDAESARLHGLLKRAYDSPARPPGSPIPAEAAVPQQPQPQSQCLDRDDACSVTAPGLQEEVAELRLQLEAAISSLGDGVCKALHESSQCEQKIE